MSIKHPSVSPASGEKRKAVRHLGSKLFSKRPRRSLQKVSHKTVHTIPVRTPQSSLSKYCAVAARRPAESWNREEKGLPSPRSLSRRSRSSQRLWCFPPRLPRVGFSLASTSRLKRVTLDAFRVLNSFCMLVKQGPQKQKRRDLDKSAAACLPSAGPTRADKVLRPCAPGSASGKWG